MDVATLMDNNISWNDELYHYGVKGMKWGHRKNPEVQKAYDNMRSKKAAYKQAYKKYSKDFDSAYNYDSSHVIRNLVSKKSKQESNKRWDNSTKSQQKAQRAQSTYKQAKKDYKQAKKERNIKINKKADELRRKASLGEKLMYNNATRTRAAKYIVDNNMSVKEATKKAKSDAWANTAAFVAAAAGTTILYNKLK